MRDGVILSAEGWSFLLDAAFRFFLVGFWRDAQSAKSICPGDPR